MATPVLRSAAGRIFLRVLIFGLLLLPLWMWLAWLLKPNRPLVVAIIDKTVLTPKGQEHISLDWVLNHERYTKNRRDQYLPERDYFGFFPGEKEHFRLKGLERFSEDQLKQLSLDADVAYITDAYGIYYNEWYKKGDPMARSGSLYGGMSRQDLDFLKLMQARHKLVITEFNCLGSPTASLLNDEFGRSFGVYWSGWVGRYFDSFDTAVNKDIPRWLIRNYMLQHGGQWPFRRSGIACVNISDEVVVLENGTHLNTEFPVIHAGREAREHYGLPESIKYTYWFDMVRNDTGVNQVLATYGIDVNDSGRKELARHGLPAVFPAISAHRGADYRFFYFSGDFCDNPIGLTSSRFRGIPYFWWMMYNRRDPQERQSFFWKVYRPLVTRILDDYYPQRPPSHLGDQAR